ncbi:androglobin-like isoform X18, partial [Biomphalaria pfeifferi]
MAAKMARKGGGARGPSATPRDGTSLTINTNVVDAKKSKIVVWPEWNDADVNAEKW